MATKAQRKPATGSAVSTAKEQPAPDPSTVCQIVVGEGTDEEIAARCASSIPGWDGLTEKVRSETVRLMRVYWNLSPNPRYAVVETDRGRSIKIPQGDNATLHTLRTIEAMASNSEDFVNERLYDLSKYFRGDDASSTVTAALAFVVGAKAQDTVQSTLAVQMATTHDAAMRALGRATHAQHLEHAQVFGNLATKLLNAYTRQAEVLAKLQRGGEQVIKHVHIDNRNGGQAIVTDHLVTGGQNAESRDQPYAHVSAMLGQDPSGYGVPISGDPGQEAMPIARRAVAGRA